MHPARVALFALALASACSRRAPEAAPTAGSPAGSGAPSADAAPQPQPISLLFLPVSPYHASLVTDGDDTAYLLVSSAAYRLAPGVAPAARLLDLGLGPAATRSSFVHWSRGAVFETPKDGAPARRLIALPRQPQLFVAAGEDFAWLQRTDDGRFSLHALIGKKAVAVYTSPGKIDAVTMLGDAIYFVERPAGETWRIGRVPRPGGTATFTPPRSGRAPAMLAAGRDIHYYDGKRFEVHRLSPDLQRERTLASGFVCSPIAAAAHVYCAQPEGIFELRADERPRRLVPGSTERPVTELAATATRLLWVVDAGADKLEVRALALTR
jgi:hypothetical protein